MKNSFLILLGLVFGVLSLYAYIHTESKKTHYRAPQITNMDFSATDIRSMRSNAKGVVEAKLSAGELKHYVKPAEYRVEKVSSEWKDEPYIINMKADKATIEDNPAQKTMLSGHVSVRRFQPGDTANRNTMTLTTDNLVALPTEKAVYTQSPAHITGPTLDVYSKYGLYANFNTGTYEFFQARMNYAAPNKSK